MARQITPTTIGALLAVFFLFAIFGYLAYLFLFATKAPAIPPQATSYDTSVLTKDLDNKNPNSIFIPTKLLSTTTSNTTGSVTYAPDELGKVDITRSGN